MSSLSTTYCPLVVLSVFCTLVSSHHAPTTKSPDSYLFIEDPDVDPSKYLTKPSMNTKFEAPHPLNSTDSDKASKVPEYETTGKQKPSERSPGSHKQHQQIIPFPISGFSGISGLSGASGMQGLNLGGINIGGHSCDRLKLYLAVLQKHETVETIQLGERCLVSFKAK